MIIYKKFVFDSAHFLPNVPERHKCKNMHGHTYGLIIFIEGKIKQPEGWVIDFGNLKACVKPVLDKLDHHCLNDIPGLENPTSEILAVWLWSQLKPAIPELKRIELSETATSGVIYEG
jgi:6-pyruvoyltetrahydropterin/6-carboxytetrahydropterin synthase